MNKLIFSLLAGLIISIMAAVYSNGVEADISNGIVRLHIIANSNSNDDQAVKLEVRNSVIQAQRQGKISDIDDIVAIADEVLYDNGFTYAAKAERGRFYFPTKEYKNVRMPAGMYDAVRITLGNGEGENWWCIMYPPLCFTEECQGEITDDGMTVLKESMNDESTRLITEKSPEIEMKFKVVEVVQKICNHNK